MNADDPNTWLPFRQWRSRTHPKACIETLCTGYVVNPGTGDAARTKERPLGDSRRADDLDSAKRYAVQFGIPFDSWYEVEQPN